MRAGAASPVRNGSRRSNRQLRRAGGQVAVLFAIAAVAIVAVVGLAFDAGRAYVDQRALQAAVDTAGDGGARMLAQAYDGCQSGSPVSSQAPTDILDTVDALVASGVAGQGQATSPPTADFVYYDPATRTTTDLGTIAGASSAGWCAGWTASPVSTTVPNGVKVTAVDLHSTAILGVIGIRSAQERATSISAFTATPGPGAPFVAWYQDCALTGTPFLVPGDTIIYHASNHWSSDVNCAQQPVNSRFKGDLKPEGLNPNPITTIPTWVNAQPGQGSWGPNIQPSSTVPIVLPMIDCIADGAPCTEPSSSVLPGAPFCGAYGLATSNQLYMCVIGEVLVYPVNGCTKSLECEGVVDKVIFPVPSGTPALFLSGVSLVELVQ